LLNFLKLQKTMKKLFSICAFLMLVSGIYAVSTKFTVNGITYNTTYGTAVEVTSNINKYSGSITIPSTVVYSAATYNVTSIGVSAFRNCSELTSITIPSSVTTIEDYAFYESSKLTNIDVNANNANFSSTSGILFNKNKTTIVCYPGGKQSGYTIPSSVTSIGKYAFSGCTNLTSITIPSNVTSIGDYAFFGCTGLTSVTIPNSITSIGAYVFSKCSQLTSISFPNSITSIGANGFSSCSKLASISIPNSVTSIGDYAFSYCNNLTSITTPSSLSTIANYVFYGCHALTSVIIPNTVTSIGNSAFYNCTKLSSITIPNSVTAIGSEAFLGCTKLASIIIPSSVTSIAASAFKSCSGLTSVDFPSSVTSIGNFAFYNCTGLTSISLPSAVTSIGSSAFYGCSSITSLTCLCCTPPTLGSSCFNGATSISDVFVPSNDAVNAYKANASWIGSFPGTIIKSNTTTAYQTQINNRVNVYAAASKIVINGLIGTGKMELYTLNGKQIQSRKWQGNDAISIGSIPHGWYVMKLITSKGIDVMKIQIK